MNTSVPTKSHPGLRVFFQVHLLRKGPHAGRTHGQINDAATGELLVMSDIEYCTTAILERGWEVVDATDALKSASRNTAAAA